MWFSGIEPEQYRGWPNFLKEENSIVYKSFPSENGLCIDEKRLCGASMGTCCRVALLQF
jgi:hypothetical protein